MLKNQIYKKGLLKAPEKLEIDVLLYAAQKIEKKEDFYTSSRELVHEGRFQLSYPFHEFSTMKLDFFCREDRSVVLSTENTNLKKPDHIMTYLGFKSEYIFDNSIYIATNIYEGTRFKVYYELFRNFENTNQGFSVIGADYRKYIPIHRNIIFASRFAGAGCGARLAGCHRPVPADVAGVLVARYSDPRPRRWTRRQPSSELLRGFLRAQSAEASARCPWWRPADGESLRGALA